MVLNDIEESPLLLHWHTFSWSTNLSQYLIQMVLNDFAESERMLALVYLFLVNQLKMISDSDDIKENHRGVCIGLAPHFTPSVTGWVGQS